MYFNVLLNETGITAKIAKIMFTNSRLKTQNSKLKTQKPLSGPFFFFLFWISCFILPMSCVEESERLTRAERKAVDTMVIKRTKALRAASDSLCSVSFEASVTQVVDSILAKRLEEIKKILDQ